jgi:hypothetical protein
VCRSKDFYKFKRSYLPGLQDVKRLKLVTFTVKNGEHLSGQAVRRPRKLVTKLMRRAYYKKRVRGGLQTIEVTDAGKGRHPHMHVLMDADYMPEAKLQRDWRELTGDSFIVDIREVGSVEEALDYCLGDRRHHFDDTNVCQNIVDTDPAGRPRGLTGAGTARR